MKRIDDPDFVAGEYADESRLAARRRVWNEFLEGRSADDAILDAVIEGEPGSVLEVGGGWGHHPYRRPVLLAAPTAGVWQRRSARPVPLQ